jgi:hypothetical protein
MKTSALLAALVVLPLMSARADAQQMTLQIQNGLVTLDAQNVSVRQILAEWARVGGAKIVNGEKVAGGPVTLQLKDVSERQALDTILRGVSGYMLASRQAGSVGASGFDRILILPTSSAPRPTVPPTNAGFVPRPMPPPVQPVPVPGEPEPVDTEIIPDEDHDEADVEPEVDGSEEPDPPEAGPNQQFPGPNQPFQRSPFPNPMGAQQQPFAPQGAFPGVPQQDDEGAPVKPTTMPLNVPPGASTVPGVISPAPTPPEPPVTRPRTTRPPSL